jgi:hypothetical protein
VSVIRVANRAARAVVIGIDGRQAGVPVARSVPNGSVVLLENGLQSVGEDVGGTYLQPREAPSQAESRPQERRDRTQEVAGSSPASSMKPPQNGGFFVWERAFDYIQALGFPMHLKCRFLKHLECIVT